MTNLIAAFQRWLAAEQDVHDANLFALSEMQTNGWQTPVAQVQVVAVLRKDAYRLLSKFLRAAELDAGFVLEPLFAGSYRPQFEAEFRHHA